MLHATFSDGQMNSLKAQSQIGVGHQWLSGQGIVIAAALVGVFWIQTLIIKAIELVHISGSFNFVSFLQITAQDTAVASGLFLVFAILFSIRIKVLAFIVKAFCYLLMLVLMILLAGSHGYYMATGSHLSAFTVGVWLEDLATVSKIAASEAGSWKIPLLILQVVLVGSLVVTFHVSPLRHKLKRLGQVKISSFLVALAVSVALFIVAAFVPPPSGAARDINRSVPTTIVSEFVGDLFGEAEVELLMDSYSAQSVLKLKASPDGPRPNIVIILYESLNWKSSDVYVPGRNTTPFLAKLAEKSLVVENHYTIVPHTSKAIVASLCGFPPYPGVERIESMPGILPKQCIAHMLSDLGYQTAFFQPAVNFENRSQLVKNMGFETFRGLTDMPLEGFEQTSYFGREDLIMLEPTLDWAQAQKDAPFFLTVLTLASHHNYVTPQSFGRIDYPDEDPDQRNYLNAIRYLDHFVEELYKGFEARGLLDNTVFFIVGDHGEAFAEHGRRQHDLIMWEEGIRCASLIHSPTYFPEPGRITGTRSHLDILPTIADLLEVELVEGEFEGTSMLGPVPKDRKLFFSCWFNKQCMAVRDGPIKTIYHFNQQPMEVYDNSTDELDERDLAGKDEYGSEFLYAKKEEMLDWRLQTLARYRAWENAISAGKILEEKPEVGRKLEARFGDAIELVGFDVKPERARPGQDLAVRYVFHSLKKTSRDIAFFVHVIKPDGILNADHVPVGGSHPVPNWRPGQYIIDEHDIHIPANWPGGPAKIGIGFWDKKTGKRLAVSGDKLEVRDNRLVIATIPVVGAGARVGLDADAIRSKVAKWIRTEVPPFDQPGGATFGGMIELTGVTLKRTDVKQAGTAEMEYVFKALADIPKGVSLRVSLVEDNGEVIVADHDPINGLLPPDLWRVGEYVIDQHLIHIDKGDCKPGTYSVWLGFQKGREWLAATGDGRIDELGRVYLGEIIIRPRTELQ